MNAMKIGFAFSSFSVRICYHYFKYMHVFCIVKKNIEGVFQRFYFKGIKYELNWTFILQKLTLIGHTVKFLDLNRFENVN